MWGPGFHLDRPGASSPTLWLIHRWSSQQHDFAVVMATAAHSYLTDLPWDKMKEMKERLIFVCVRAWLCANHCRLWVVLDRRHGHYVSSAAIVMLCRSTLVYVGGVRNTILISYWQEINQLYLLFVKVWTVIVIRLFPHWGIIPISQILVMPFLNVIVLAQTWCVKD